MDDFTAVMWNDVAVWAGRLTLAILAAALLAWVLGRIGEQVRDALNARVAESVRARRQWTDTQRGRAETADRLTYLDDYEAADQEDYR